MGSQQCADGSFSATRSGSESDMRFLYCACAISHMLGDWSGVDKLKAKAYIDVCTTYEGGIALVPGTYVHIHWFLVSLCCQLLLTNYTALQL
jgi:geranylgeranyl transferase type-1 subunit beta